MDVSAEPEAQQQVMRKFTYIMAVWFLIIVTAGLLLVHVGLGGL